MWHEVVCQKELDEFLEKVYDLHDSCIAELRYISGAYVDENRAMYPFNDKRNLRVLIHQQCKDHPVIEMEFPKLKYLKLVPVDDNYTCEIGGISMAIWDGFFYWCDCSNVPIAEMQNYDGTVICASGFRWRFAQNQ